MVGDFHIGDPVRVKKGWPFEGWIGQVHSVLDSKDGVYDVAFSFPRGSLNEGRGGLVPFRGEQLEHLDVKT